jgi:L-asparagine transporter-like permease
MTNVTLVRGLGAIAATAIVVGDVIGTGVFLKARVMTCNVGTPGRVLLVWIVGGLLSLAGALTYAELAAMMPRAGGEYVFIREAYGRLWGFLYGWTRFFVATTAARPRVCPPSSSTSPAAEPRIPVGGHCAGRRCHLTLSLPRLWPPPQSWS